LISVGFHASTQPTISAITPKGLSVDIVIIVIVNANKNMV